MNQIFFKKTVGPHSILIVVSWLVMILVLHVFTGNQRASVKCLFRILLSQHVAVVSEEFLHCITWKIYMYLKGRPMILKKTEF